jgi:hypothetical protein
MRTPAVAQEHCCVVLGECRRRSAAAHRSGAYEVDCVLQGSPDSVAADQIQIQYYALAKVAEDTPLARPPWLATGSRQSPLVSVMRAGTSRGNADRPNGQAWNSQNKPWYHPGRGPRHARRP